MSMSSRLKSAMKARNFTVSDLMERMDISKAALYFLLDGTTTPDKVRFSTVAEICKAIRISPEWLMYGVGEMDVKTYGQSQHLRITADTIAEAQKALSSMARVNGLPPSWESNPGNLALAINTVIEIGFADGGNVIDLMAGIASKLRKGALNAVDGGTKGDSDSTAVSSNGHGTTKA